MNPHRTRNAVAGFMSNRFARWSANAQARYDGLPATDIPSAVFLPCRLFTADLPAGIVTDYDVKRAMIGATTDEFGCAAS